ncbi:NAD(P)/FAD-dependent oxidoreductase [Curvivirga aplysinae]|uniref:NAD(P)/FAD-dependent oxidoreductase n=1 Tax=Curvivirga aplysinae TaxID=2529852 RepID=UPI0012BCAA36|nr:FAD-binding oxidoreductase [Curvivirga aplysinae]MTI08375.1 FAD-binding oxidoreductase [Curvivirga aplysinae]
MLSDVLTIKHPQPYPESYYAASRIEIPDRPALSDTVEVDVCVVGAGFSGMSTALFLAEKGYQVALLEACHVGWGAAGRNGGHLINGFNGGVSFLEKHLGVKDHDVIKTFHLEGAEIIKDWVGKYDIQCDLKFGHMITAYTDKQVKELEEEIEQLHAYGLSKMHMVDREVAQKETGSSVYAGGYKDPYSGHLHPLNLVLGEAAAFEKLGGKIFEQSPMIGYASASYGVLVKTAKGQVKAKKLVLCGEAYMGDTEKRISKRMMPVSTQVIATEPLSEAQQKEILPNDLAVADCRYILDYFRLSADKRLIFGGGSTYGGSTPAQAEQKLRGNLEKVYPQLKGIKADYVWTGNMAFCYTRHPDLGTLTNNVYYLHGFCGHGVNVTHIYGRTMAEAIDEKFDRYNLFTKAPQRPFPGGQRFRVPYSIMGSWWYGLRDRLGV